MMPLTSQIFFLLKYHLLQSGCLNTSKCNICNFSKISISIHSFSTQSLSIFYVVRLMLNYRDMVDLVSTLMEFSARENQQVSCAGRRLITGETKEISENIDRTSIKTTKQLHICLILAIVSRRLNFFHSGSGMCSCSCA